ncbi:aspartic proteinase nepenthesin-2-like [Cucumis melo var. makuwa]|uniref:Aspartic proteinase nepenthesin-2-like n=1 Tax=Cucumis melo var. makuwa TaxID=1194695 RepID=A0A5D3CAS4_CUCMM|nr:aspartic proteinase nepenthesin-2-like [Cucumis melo var. makuwa]
MEFLPIPFLFSIFLLLPTSSSSSITLPLTTFPSIPFTDPLKTINHLLSASLSRAQHLKSPQSKSNTSTENVSLFPRSYGAYAVSLAFGTPPQNLSFIFDTGSSLVWFPCTAGYRCAHCSFPHVDPATISKFVPKLSSSVKIVGCRNPKCAWIFGPNLKSRCRNCNPKSRKCSDSCPGYGIQYGSGATAGILLSETLDLQNKRVPDFLVGCSVMSVRQPAGIAGFGRGPESLPSQMRLKRFSHCLLPRGFDDSPVSSPLVLDSGPESDESKTKSFIYAPFQENPSRSNTAFREYYYLSLRRILIGGKPVKFPYKYLVPDSTGKGGAIIDSGSTFTFLDKPIFEAIAGELEKQLVKYPRAKDIEAKTGLRPCFNISKEEESAEFPEVALKFKGGGKLSLPPENYLVMVTDANVVCLTMMTNAEVVGVGGGPAIIFGAFQQQNVLVEYDLAKQRIGFRKQKCT